MKRALSYIAAIIGLAIGVFATTAVAQTTANGPYYATPSWDQTLPSSTRFIVLSNFANASVLDRNTGLVWERTPDATYRNWYGAKAYCIQKVVGGQKGWRLPSIQELASLADPSVAIPGPTLPAGHPFQGVASWSYWSSTLSTGVSPAAAWFQSFFDGGELAETLTDVTNYAWCVRGPNGADAQ